MKDKDKGKDKGKDEATQLGVPPELLEDVIAVMDKRTAMVLANHCAAMAFKLDGRKEYLRDLVEEDLSPFDLVMASLTERLALFEMLIEAMTLKLDDLEARLGGKKGNN